MARARKRGEGRLVVVGASAGGVDALRAIVSGLDPSFAAPIVVAQHIDPRRRSHLAEVLTRTHTPRDPSAWRRRS
jgi:two-component system, chemotaxis family, CheB/CheR fusion protein